VLAHWNNNLRVDSSFHSNTLSLLLLLNALCLAEKQKIQILHSFGWPEPRKNYCMLIITPSVWTICGEPWPINLYMRVTNWPNIFVDQGHFSDPDFISRTHQRENVQFADKSIYISTTPMVKTDIITRISCIRWDNNDNVRSVLDKIAKMDFHSASSLKQQSAGRQFIWFSGK
jgi:hypothetical protein